MGGLCARPPAGQDGAPAEALDDPGGAGGLEVAEGAPAEAAGLNPSPSPGGVPPAARPAWLPGRGPGQANVDPLRWGLTVEQWVFFIGECSKTDTWNALAKQKAPDPLDGEYLINMYDVNEHFVKPWTDGTGSSIALLLNSTRGREPQPVQLMLSHGWGASVIETYNALQNCVNHGGIPMGTFLFFCCLSMYQPEDGAEGGLSISEQLQAKPFARIIGAGPTHGMYVIHTTALEVYSRLWTVHEVDEAVLAGVRVRGMCDMYAFSLAHLDESVDSIDTSQGEVSREEDRRFLTALIEERGGFARLDGVIQRFRRKMREEIRAFLEVAEERGNPTVQEGNSKKNTRDWTCRFAYDFYGDPNGAQIVDYTTGWTPQRAWVQAMLQVNTTLGLDESVALLTQGAQGKQGAQAALRKSFWRKGCGGPLGIRSFPYGPPARWEQYQQDPFVFGDMPKADSLVAAMVKVGIVGW